jgi:hypothetical protein
VRLAQLTAAAYLGAPGVRPFRPTRRADRPHKKRAARMMPLAQFAGARIPDLATHCSGSCGSSTNGMLPKPPPSKRPAAGAASSRGGLLPEPLSRSSPFNHDSRYRSIGQCFDHVSDHIGD